MRCHHLLLGIALATAFLPAGAVAAGDSPAEKLLAEPRVLGIGHRGYNALAPENTLPSFQMALTAAVDLVELDYHHTKDGVPVVIHDYELDRTTDAVAKWGGKKLRVDARTAAELRTLDAGKWFTNQFAGTTLPTLDEALQYIQPRGMTLIERKGGEAATCVKLLRDRAQVNRLIVQSFDWEYLKEYHALETQQVLGALGPPSARAGRKLTEAEKELAPEWITAAKATGSQVVVWNKLVSRAAVDFAHQQGMKVWIYTINDEATARALLAHGIDGLISDNPALIWRVLALRKTPARE
jgi:glycerophosphoryl diester phosphodiesterase